MDPRNAPVLAGFSTNGDILYIEKCTSCENRFEDNNRLKERSRVFANLIQKRLDDRTDYSIGRLSLISYLDDGIALKKGLVVILTSAKKIWTPRQQVRSKNYVEQTYLI